MIIVKVGGGKTIQWENIAKDLKEIMKKEPVILVHGAGVTRDEIAEKLHTPTKTITSPSGITSVYTDKQAIDVFLMAYPGLVNKTVVATLQSHGITAVGLSGVDGALWRAKRKNDVLSVENGKTKLITGNLTGRVEAINTKLLTVLVENGYLPVICAPAISVDHEIVNTDNDWATAVMAHALGVTRLVFLFEAPGLLRDLNDPTSLIPHIAIKDIDEYLSVAKGRMKKKILGAKKACEGGVQTIYWGDGRTTHPVLDALAGKGTVISAL